MTEFLEGQDPEVSRSPRQVKTVNPLEGLSTPDGEVVENKELTPEQLRIRELEDQLAKSLGNKEPEEVLDFESLGVQGNLVIHFVRDGFTALGRVWYKGQELEFSKDSQSYKDTFDRVGNSWLHYDESTQVAKYGHVFYRRGPWPGERYQAAFGPGKGPSIEQLEEAEAREAARKRAAPVLPVR